MFIIDFFSLEESISLHRWQNKNIKFTLLKIGPHRLEKGMYKEKVKYDYWLNTTDTYRMRENVFFTIKFKAL